jgi:transposase-like protein
MHLSVRLPKVEPDAIPAPTTCPLMVGKRKRRRCSGQHFKLHQVACDKPLRDLRHPHVQAQRYRCLSCQRTFRVYPRGVSAAQQSNNLKALSVLLYVLGLSYQGVSDVLDALGQALSKSSVYNNVQAAGARAIEQRNGWLHQHGTSVKVLGIDCTHVKRLGQDTILAVASAILTGETLSIEILADESAESLRQWAQTLATSLQAEVLVSDDADAMKTVADALGLDQQLCRAHVNRNLHDLVASLGTKALEHPDRVPAGTELSVPQLLDDLQQVEELIKGLAHDGQQQLDQLAERYQCAPPPKPGQKASMWYRMRMLTLDWSENWSRLTRFQSWRGLALEKLDGTNNVTERIVGQYIKERYRSMRGYKRKQSILNVSGLTAWLGMQPAGYDLGAVV